MNKIIVIAGPTAVGKTLYAIELAELLETEIISADSMQVYKHMDIGTAKPTTEEMSRIKHHMIDVADPCKNDFSVAVYREQAESRILELHDKGKIPIIAGGTGLYINSLLYEMDFSNAIDDPEYRAKLDELCNEKGPVHLHGLLKSVDPDSAQIIHPNNIKKVIRALEVYNATGQTIKKFSRDLKPNSKYDSLFFCLHRERSLLYDRINSRVEEMFREGLLDEVSRLVEMGLAENHIAMKGIGYKEVLEHLSGKFDLDETICSIKQNSRHYAKRQLTWFRRYKEAIWIELLDSHDQNMARLEKEINKFLK